jgi:hypothetical protein
MSVSIQHGNGFCFEPQSAARTKEAYLWKLLLKNTPQRCCGKKRENAQQDGTLLALVRATLSGIRAVLAHLPSSVDSLGRRSFARLFFAEARLPSNHLYL